MDFLSWFALAIIIFIVLSLAYGMIAIHDVPYHIAKKRDHPHQDTIHTAGWVSLFTLHAIWPFLWIWATIYHPKHGYRGPESGEFRGKDGEAEQTESPDARIARLEERIQKLESSVEKPSKA